MSSLAVQPPMGLSSSSRLVMMTCSRRVGGGLVSVRQEGVEGRHSPSSPSHSPASTILSIFSRISAETKGSSSNSSRGTAGAVMSFNSSFASLASDRSLFAGALLVSSRSKEAPRTRRPLASKALSARLGVAFGDFSALSAATCAERSAAFAARSASLVCLTRRALSLLSPVTSVAEDGSSVTGTVSTRGDSAAFTVSSWEVPMVFSRVK